MNSEHTLKFSNFYIILIFSKIYCFPKFLIIFPFKAHNIRKITFTKYNYQLYIDIIVTNIIIINRYNLLFDQNQ